MNGLPIEHYDPPVRVFNILKRGGYHTRESLFAPIRLDLPTLADYYAVRSFVCAVRGY